ncbi:MAG: hypothetical protein ACFFCZ_31405 [Promethearchaeota archaeon]
MKDLKILILILIASIVVFCERTPSGILLVGSWLEITEKNDTIDFTQFTSQQAINLRREYELQNGHWTQKGGMFYYFLLNSDSIALNSIYSSICPDPDPNCYPHHHFKLISDDMFEIGNFYNLKLSHHEILTFSKLD